jgi:hypothetical protein
MSDIDIDIRITNAGKVPPSLKQGLEDGLQDSGEAFLDKGEDKAKDVIFSADRVWRKTLKQGFRTEDDRTSTFYSWSGKINNDAPHAKINEDGRDPGNAPSVQDIIPWVDDKLTPNADAQEKAERANVEEWNPQLQGLAGIYSPAMVITAFAVKGGLEEKGYPGIGFMETTEAYLKQIGPLLVKRKVEKHMNRELRQAGLK